MDRAKYVRIYTDEAGESHFEDLETELIFMEFAPPEAPLATAPFLPSAKIEWLGAPDRKSTRLNSSHKPSSYAVFCLKKKKYFSFLSFFINSTFRL